MEPAILEAAALIIMKSKLTMVNGKMSETAALLL